MIVDDHEMIIDCVVNGLRGEFDVVVAKTAAQMREYLAKERFGLVLMDLDLRDGSNGVDLLPELNTAQIPVMILSGTATKADLRTCVAMGVRGFFDKRESESKLLPSIQAVVAGHQSFPPGVLASLHQDDRDKLPRMSRRELDVLNQVFAVPVRANEVIAEALHLSTGRVKNILTDLFRKFEVNTRHELSLEARRRGYHPEQRTPVVAERSGFSPIPRKDMLRSEPGRQEANRAAGGSETARPITSGVDADDDL